MAIQNSTKTKEKTSYDNTQEIWWANYVFDQLSAFIGIKDRWAQDQHSVQSGLYPSLYAYPPFSQNVPIPQKAAIFSEP